MALADLTRYISKEMHDLFHKPESNNSALLKKAKKAVKTAREGYATYPEPRRGKKATVWSVQNGIFAFHPGVIIDGQPRWFANASDPKEVKQLLDDMDKELDALDPEKDLAEALIEDGGDTGGGAPAKVRKPRGPMSDEAKAAMSAKRAQTMAANGTRPGARPKEGEPASSEPTRPTRGRKKASA